MSIALAEPELHLTSSLESPKSNMRNAGMTPLNSEVRINTSVLSLALGTGVLCADILLKQWAQHSLTHPVFVTQWLCLAIQHNSGLFLGIVPIDSGAVGHLLLLAAAILWMAWRAMSATNSATRAGYALVTGRLAGNALDRLNGSVVDYLGFGPVVEDKWIFANLADVAMLLGAVVLTVVFVRGVSGRERSPAQDRDSKERS